MKIDFKNIKWFNMSSPWFCRIRMLNLFNRVSKDGHFWGIGLFQIGNRHLIYAGHQGIKMFFIGKTI